MSTATLGLRPKRSQSGERDPQLGITKAGNAYLRKPCLFLQEYGCKILLCHRALMDDRPRHAKPVT
ncbi:transposase [Tunturiibacter lichenicola]|uniref:transposase n=1 Tax=Tunturiibacter lichenicola TaxID=2051959 RepID=UPI0036F2BE33